MTRIAWPVALGPLVLAVATPASPPVHAAERFAVAGGDAGVACLATTRPLPALPVRVAIGITAPEAATTMRRAVITQRLSQPCRALAVPDLPGAFYALRFEGEPPHDGWLGVADFGGPAHVALRACTSMEGVHLTAWPGRSLRRGRLWHAYVYLGYDVSPTCTDAETRATSPR